MTTGKTGSKRVRPKLAKSQYFTDEKPNYKFVSTGCTKLDCDLGGGLALGRITNIVGDKSTAKTAMATEAVINFIKNYPGGVPAYRDAEAAYDKPYAQAMGLSIEMVDFGDEDKPLITVEDFARDFEKYLNARIKDKKPGIYVLDSLDSLSDEAEMEREFGKASYGMGKAKGLSEFFRRGMARKIEQTNVLLLIVSQVRENIGVMFGEKYRRAGGKALDHYASQIIWLALRGAPLKKQLNKIERVVGVPIRAKIKKNKVGLSFREADFNFIFAYGIDDLESSVRWLGEVGKWPQSEDFPPKEYLAEVAKLPDDEYNEEVQKMAKQVKQVWGEVETSFLPRRSKYG